MQKQVFLDYASATPVSEKVREAMLPFFSENFFNPSAAYLPSKHLRKIYEDYKDQLAHTIGAKGNDLVITAGATESINLAFTVFKKYPDAKCLILETEHSAVLESAKHYAKNIELIKVDSTGLIKLDDLKQKIDDRTAH